MLIAICSNGMKILIRTTKLDLTPSFKTYIEEKLGSVEKFLKRWEEKGSVVLRVEVARTTKHHKKGEVFYAETNLDIPRGVIRAESYHSDARLAINAMEKILRSEIKKHKEKMEIKRR